MDSDPMKLENFTNFVQNYLGGNTNDFK